MCGLKQISSYIRHRNESFNQIVEKQNGIYIIKESSDSYKKNWGEKLGNALLAPQGCILKDWDKTTSIIRKTALVFATLLLSVITLFGLIIKKMGECVNPVGHLRSQALSVKQEFAHLHDEQLSIIQLQGYAALLLARNEGWAGLYLKALQKRYGANQNDLIASGYYLNKDPQSVTSTNPELQTMKQLNANWHSGWTAWAESTKKMEIPSTECENRIYEMAAIDDELLASVKDYCRKQRKLIENHHKLIKLFTKYSNLQSQLIAH